MTALSADLPARLRDRAPGAIDELYDLYGTMVYRFLAGMVSDTGIAEDLTQETFLRCWRSAKKFTGGRGTLGMWLTAIARNLARDHFRSSSAKFRRRLLELTPECPCAEESTDASMLRWDCGRRLDEAFAKLSPSQREIVDLAYYQGFSQSEISRKLHRPLGTVKTRARGALLVLREAMAGQTSPVSGVCLGAPPARTAR